MLPGKELVLVHIAIDYLVHIALIDQDREIQSNARKLRRDISGPSDRHSCCRTAIYLVHFPQRTTSANLLQEF